MTEYNLFDQFQVGQKVENCYMIKLSHMMVIGLQQGSFKLITVAYLVHSVDENSLLSLGDIMESA